MFCHKHPADMAANSAHYSGPDLWVPWHFPADSRAEEDGPYFAEDIFIYISFIEVIGILIEIMLKFVPTSSIDI